jgi:hypothetical protein
MNIQTNTKILNVNGVCGNQDYISKLEIEKMCVSTNVSTN